MASREDNNLTQSATVFLYGEVRDAIPSDPSPPEHSCLLQGAKDFMDVYEEKRVVLDIDLNVSLTADEDVEFPAAKHGGMCSKVMEIGWERNINNGAWEALLEAAEMASAEYEECPREREKKIGAQLPVLRLRRERAAALPNKYRDSVLDYTVEAAIIATKRT